MRPPLTPGLRMPALRFSVSYVAPGRQSATGFSPGSGDDRGSLGKGPPTGEREQHVGAETQLEGAVSGDVEGLGQGVTRRLEGRPESRGDVQGVHGELEGAGRQVVADA